MSTRIEPYLSFGGRGDEALAHGGNVTMPLSRTFWSLRFGTLTDRSGVSWMVSVAADQPC